MYSRAAEASDTAEVGTVENVDYATKYIFTDYSIAAPTAENFTTNITEPEYTYTWYEITDTSAELMEGRPKKPGSYTLQVDVTSTTDEMTASITVPITIEYYDTLAEATVEDKVYDYWDEVILTAPEGFAIAAQPSKWEFSGNPEIMLAVDSRGTGTQLSEDGDVIYYLMDIQTKYISDKKTISVKVNEENAPMDGIMLNGKVNSTIDEETTYTEFYKNPVTVNVSGYDEYLILPEGGAYDEFDETNEWTLDEGEFSISENGAYKIYARGINKIVDDMYYENTNGFIVYKDTEQSTQHLVYTKTTNVDKSINVKFNENTVKSVAVGETELSEEQYEVNDKAIILTGSYLETLDAGQYTVTVSYNPYGREYVEKEGNEAPNDTIVELTVNEIENNDVIEGEDCTYILESNDGVSEVPESFADNPKLDTVEEIESQMKVYVQQENPDITEENIEVYEVTLLVKFSEDGMKFQQILLQTLL